MLLFKNRARGNGTGRPLLRWPSARPIRRGSGQGTDPLKVTQDSRPWSVLGAHRPSPVVLPLCSPAPRTSPAHPWVPVCPEAATPSWRQNQYVKELEQDPVSGCPPPDCLYESNLQRCVECQEQATCKVWLGAGWAGQERAMVQALCRYLTSTYLCWAFGITK